MLVKDSDLAIDLVHFLAVLIVQVPVKSQAQHCDLYFVLDCLFLENVELTECLMTQALGFFLSLCSVRLLVVTSAGEPSLTLTCRGLLAADS